MFSEKVKFMILTTKAVYISKREFKKSVNELVNIFNLHFYSYTSLLIVTQSRDNCLKVNVLLIYNENYFFFVFFILFAAMLFVGVGFLINYKDENSVQVRSIFI